jgi:hypothetical protein
MFGSIFPKVLDLVRGWTPKKKYSNESDYRDDLLNFLRENINRPDPLGLYGTHSIRKESGRHLADIGINGQIGIELKKDLDTKSKADRLWGQIDDYLKGYSKMIVVLCGDSNEEQFDYIKEKVRKMPKDLFASTQIEII